MITLKRSQILGVDFKDHIFSQKLVIQTTGGKIVKHAALCGLERLASDLRYEMEEYERTGEDRVCTFY